ncbi:MAG: hypothetical protein QXU88_00595 [Candidatus Woesearchaeota archaeon]
MKGTVLVVLLVAIVFVSAFVWSAAFAQKIEVKPSATSEEALPPAAAGEAAKEQLTTEPMYFWTGKGFDYWEPRRYTKEQIENYYTTKGITPEPVDARIGRYGVQNKGSRLVDKATVSLKDGTLSRFVERGTVIIRADKKVEVQDLSGKKLWEEENEQSFNDRFGFVGTDNAPLFISVMAEKGVLLEKLPKATVGKTISYEDLEIFRDSQGNLVVVEKDRQLTERWNSAGEKIERIFGPEEGPTEGYKFVDNKMQIYSNGRLAYTADTELINGKRRVVFVVDGKSYYLNDASVLIDKNTNKPADEKTVEKVKDVIGKDNYELIVSSNAAKAGALTVGEYWNSVWRAGGIVGVLNQFVQNYYQWSGIGNLGSLFIGQKKLAEQRQKAAESLCKTIILGGTKCWTSKICQKSSDITIGGNTAILTTQKGGIYIRPEKSTRFEFVNETTGERISKRLYKVEYRVLNLEKEPISYNIVFVRNDSMEKNYFASGDTNAQLKPGESVVRSSTDPIINYASSEYIEACIVFSKAVKSRTGKMRHKLCHPFVEVGREPTILELSQIDKEKARGAGPESQPAVPKPGTEVWD